MSDSKSPSKTERTTPAYIPWKTFISYVASLKNTTVPHTLDSTVRPSSMAGGLWRQLTSSLQFLGLIDHAKVTSDALAKLVKASGTSDWKKAVVDHVLPAYAAITEGVPIDRASSGQLEKGFRTVGGVDGQMLDKAVRFYLHALKDAGVRYSDHLAMRKDRGGPKKPRQTKPKSDDPKTRRPSNRREDGKDYKDDESGNGTGLISFPLFFKGKPVGAIQVPEDVDADDIKLVELQVSVIKAYAAQKVAT
jgi:hypothetical protein